jgi:arylsulfatase A-like enzyme
MGLQHTHRPYVEIDPRINPDRVMPPHTLPDNDITRADFAQFMSSAMKADEVIGRVLNALEKSGRDKDTVVLYTTDHGISFPHMKCTLYDTGIGVSLILKYPENPMAGKVCDALISQIDIFPTLCDILGLNKPEWLQGHSFEPILSGTSTEINEFIFSEVNFHVAYEPMRCIRTKRYKYIRLYDQDYDGYVQTNIDDGLSKSFLIKNGLLKQRRKKEMLFDLYFDPGERCNLIGSRDYEEVENYLSYKLHRKMKETDDPLLYGRIKKPPKARVNTVTCVDPQSNNPLDYE